MWTDHLWVSFINKFGLPIANNFCSLSYSCRVPMPWHFFDTLALFAQVTAWYDVCIKCSEMSVRLKQKPAKRFRRTPNQSNFETPSAIIRQIGPTFTAPKIQPNGPGCGFKRPCCWTWFPSLTILKKCFSLSLLIKTNKFRSADQCGHFLWFILSVKRIFLSLSSVLDNIRKRKT